MSSKSRRAGRVAREASSAASLDRWGRHHDRRERDADGAIVRFFRLLDRKGRTVALARASDPARLPWEREGMPAGWTACETTSIYLHHWEDRGVKFIDSMSSLGR